MQNSKDYLFLDRWIMSNVKDSKSYKQVDDVLQDRSIQVQIRLLLIIQGMFAAANALSGTFVNVYLWKVSNDYALIGWFSLANQISIALTFWIGGKWVKEHNKMNSLRLGVAISAAFYLLVLLFQKQAVDYVLLLGAVQGMGFGFFWLAFNVVYFEVTSPETRDRFNGLAGLMTSGASMLAPWISGLLITKMKDSTGYKFIFTISLTIFLIGVITSFFLKKRKVEGSYEWFHAFIRLKEKRNPWRLAVPALIAQGIREGVFVFLIGLMVFVATNNEMQVGNYFLITSAVALFSFMLLSKWLKPHRRIFAMLIGSVMMVFVIFPFFWEVNYTTLLIFGIGTSIFMPLFIIPMTSSVFDIIGQDKESASHRVEYVVLREMGLNLGRMAGTILFIAVVSWRTDPAVINWLVLFIGSAPIAAWFFMRRLAQRTEKRKSHTH
jgi:YQGE family putative transporter